MSFLFFLDTETGGVDPFRESLLEVGLVAREDNGAIHTLNFYIREEEYRVHGVAMQVNKIDLAKAYETGYKPDAAVSRLINFAQQFTILNNGEKPLIVGHNVHMDKYFLQTLFNRFELNFDDFFNYHLLDTAVMIRTAKYAGLLPMVFPDNLSKACKFLGYEPLDEHTALGDIASTMFLFDKLVALVKGEWKMTEVEINLSTPLTTPISSTPVSTPETSTPLSTPVSSTPTSTPTSTPLSTPAGDPE
jgi:DNA polymerase III alpha subunit (gram-positive type)